MEGMELFVLPLVTGADLVVEPGIRLRLSTARYRL